MKNKAGITTQIAQLRNSEANNSDFSLEIRPFVSLLRLTILLAIPSLFSTGNLAPLLVLVVEFPRFSRVLKRLT